MEDHAEEGSGSPDEGRVRALGARPLVRRHVRTHTEERVFGAGFDVRVASAVLVALALPAVVVVWLGRADPAPDHRPRVVPTVDRAAGRTGGSPQGRPRDSRSVADVVVAPPAAAPAVRPSAPAAASSPAGPGCPSAASPAATVRADVDGDGCDEPVQVDGDRVEAVVGGERVVYRVGGAPGDQIVIGDWDCDGTATPALYRPSSGTVFSYPRWPSESEAVRPSTTAVAQGGSARVHRRGGCDDVRVGPG